MFQKQGAIRASNYICIKKALGVSQKNAANINQVVS